MMRMAGKWQLVLVLDGPLDKPRYMQNDHVDEIGVAEENYDPMGPKMNWIAAEEVCSSQVTDQNVKEENTDLDDVLTSQKESKVIKIYKHKYPARKTLKTLKMQLEAARKKLQNKYHTRQTVCKKSCKCTTGAPKKPGKRKNHDASYRCNMSAKKMKLKSKFLHFFNNSYEFKYF